MFMNALGASWQTLLLVAIATIGIYVALIVFSRLAGLRSFSEMTNFDMAATVAFGSIMATTAVTTSTSLLSGAVGLAVLFAIQWLLAQVRRIRGADRVVDSGPLLLMKGGRFIPEHLAMAQVTQNDLRGKLREAGVTRYDQVGAVVMEATGVVSVLVHGPDDLPMEPDLFSSIRGRERLFPDHEFTG